MNFVLSRREDEADDVMSKLSYTGIRPSMKLLGECAEPVISSHFEELQIKGWSLEMENLKGN